MSEFQSYGPFSFSMKTNDQGALVVLSPEPELEACAMALMVAFDNDTHETFRYITDFFVDEDGSLAFSYLARPKNDDLEDFMADFKDFEVPPQEPDENTYAYFTRLSELPELEVRDTMINACLRWELRGAFDYDKAKKEVKNVDKVARVGRAKPVADTVTQFRRK